MLYFRSFGTSVRTIPPCLLLPVSKAVSVHLITIRTTPVVLSYSLEFDIFLLEYLEFFFIIPLADFRLIRRRNRATAQRNYTFQRLERWNTHLHELLNTVGAVGNPPVPKAHSPKENRRRAERLIREDVQLGKSIQALHSHGIAPNSPVTLATLRSMHSVSALPVQGNLCSQSSPEADLTEVTEIPEGFGRCPRPSH